MISSTSTLFSPRSTPVPSPYDLVAPPTHPRLASTQSFVLATRAPYRLNLLAKSKNSKELRHERANRTNFFDRILTSVLGPWGYLFLFTTDLGRLGLTGFVQENMTYRYGKGQVNSVGWFFQICEHLIVRMRRYSKPRSLTSTEVQCRL